MALTMVIFNPEDRRDIVGEPEEDLILALTFRCLEESGNMTLLPRVPRSCSGWLLLVYVPTRHH